MCSENVFQQARLALVDVLTQKYTVTVERTMHRIIYQHTSTANHDIATKIHHLKIRDCPVRFEIEITTHCIIINTSIKT
jgi:SHS2 domain-containing protein